DLVEYRAVVRMDRDSRLRKVLAHEPLVRAAGVDDDTHGRPVYFLERVEIVLAPAAYDRRLAAAVIGRRERRLCRAVRRDADSAHRDIEAAGEMIVHQGRPARADEARLHAETLRERQRAAHVDTAQRAVALEA